MFSQEEIKKLIKHEFSRDFKEAVFTQCGTTEPLIWRGPGTLSMSPSGQLSVKAFASNEIDFSAALKNMFNRPEPAGKLLGDSGYYNMEATDYYGRTWHAERFHLDEKLFGQTNSATVSAVLSEVTSDQSMPLTAKGNRQTMLFRGKVSVPFDRCVKHSDGSISRTAFDCAFDDGTTAEIRQEAGYVVVTVEHKSQEVDHSTCDLIVEALCIASGQKMARIYQERIVDVEAEVEIWSHQVPVDHKESALWSLFERHSPTPFRAFVVGYVEFTKQTPHGFFSYWKKVYDAWQLGVFISALPLSVYIEGVVAEFFPEHRNETEDFKSEIDRVTTLLKMSSLPDDIAKRCIGAIERIKEKSTTQALKSLASEGWFSPNVIKAWGNIRHKSAHGHDITTSNADQQKLADNTFSCLHLFYLLLLIRMRFEHEFRDLSAHNFPLKRLDFTETKST